MCMGGSVDGGPGLIGSEVDMGGGSGAGWANEPMGENRNRKMRKIDIPFLIT